MIVRVPVVTLHHHLIAQIIGSLSDVFTRGAHADKSIEHAFKSHPKWGARDRKLFAESVYDIVRWWRWHWHRAGLPDAECMQKEAITEDRLWRVWAAYWITKGEEPAPFAECRAVSKASVHEQQIRKIPAAVQASIPDWLYERCAREIGTGWPEMLEALNKPAPVDLRVNTLKIATRDLQAALSKEDVEAGPVRGQPEAIRLRMRRNVFATQAFKAGLFELQDAASQRVAPFLEVAPGMRVVDACAGAGGKTLHIAALMKNKGRIIALDIHEWKLAELRRRARRNGVGIIEPRLIEGAKTIKRLAITADRVLLDVPCSGLGVLRRNPDTKWKLSPEELERLHVIQHDILRSHSRMVKPGGKLVYATCSILPSENEEQVSAFLREHGDEWKLEAELKLRPGENDGDGFYAARLIRLPKVKPSTANEALESDVE